MTMWYQLTERDECMLDAIKIVSDAKVRTGGDVWIKQRAVGGSGKNRFVWEIFKKMIARRYIERQHATNAKTHLPGRDYEYRLTAVGLNAVAKIREKRLGHHQHKANKPADISGGLHPGRRAAAAHQSD